MLAIIMADWERKTDAPKERAALHAVLNAIALADPDLARALHDDNTSKPPYSVCIEEGTGLLRIGALNEQVIGALLRGLGGRAKLVSLTTHQKLLAVDNATTTTATDGFVRLRFLTPTLFRSSDSWQETLPAPVYLFAGLLRRWGQTGGPKLPELAFHRVSASRLDLRTVPAISYGPQTEYGTVGEISYRVPMPEARYYHALAAFAEYSGVGARTGQGCGRVEYLRK
jgi:CRISPR-associated endoribonuclease Cas6